MHEFSFVKQQIYVRSKSYWKEQDVSTSEPQIQTADQNCSEPCDSKWDEIQENTKNLCSSNYLV